MAYHDLLPIVLRDEIVFPDVEDALEEPNGLLAVGGDLSRERLLLAYHKGIFPWFSKPDPIIWWSPDPRAVLYLEQLKVSRSLGKSIRNRNYQIWINKDFNQVIQGCAAARAYSDETWITDEMLLAYQDLHQYGAAHCLSVYQDGQLVGGLYGISEGRFFFGESMFSTATDASKVALYYLVQFLKSYDFLMIDCQVPNEHLTSLGSTQITRNEFIQQLEKWRDWPQPESMWQPREITENE
ncbi:MAG: leucyl/phenylalanyl-tRNA--protein transferase [Gammaproteobacteria bacterium]|nr:MAG: leucyl/phenylalanyl-tRNA--protein transferase [Gammaproteobacteria bacterium]